jgi:hypothetical protein
VGARPWLASPINSALLIAFTPGSLSLGGIGFRVLTGGGGGDNSKPQKRRDPPGVVATPVIPAP